LRFLPSLLLATTCIMVPACATQAFATEGLETVLHGPARSPKFAARDAIRHPAAVLNFFGVKPNSTVVEIWPGGGYWTEILAPYLFGYGTYYVALPAGQDPDDVKEAAAFRAHIAAAPGFYRHVTLTALGHGETAIAPPGSADFVLTFRNIHNWMEAGDAGEMFAAFYRALKPGGILGVEEHRGPTDKPQDPKAENGYVRQDYAVALAQKAGFVLDGSSEVNANPRDTKDWPKGVWTLPPTFAMGAQDHAKYAAIGEADNFVLKFKKPLH
jgi:predicted methyltransferase